MFQDIDFHSIPLEGEPPQEEPSRQYFFMAKIKRALAARSEALSRPLTYCLVTFGCQMNEKQSEMVAGILEEVGYLRTQDEDAADLVLFNTCTVRENANVRLYGRVARLGPVKKASPDKRLVVFGCMMQEEHVVEKMKKDYPFVDLIFGTLNLYLFPELFWRMMEGKGLLVDIRREQGPIVEELPAQRNFSFKSGVNIMYGCNNFCSYCIVPYVRGREISRTPEAIVQEVCALARDGVTEVMLLGQNVNSYGKTLAEPVSFARLLQMVAEVEGIHRIRFMTSHPKDLSEELIQEMARNPKVCHHLHLPLQSGSSRILKDMNRHYDKEQYLSLVKRIREVVPDLSLTTDIIVGYPGETEEDFLETLDVVEQVGYDAAFTFLYSKRSGTPAARREDQVPEDTARDRFDRLLSLVQEKGRVASSRFTGTVKEVLVECESKEKGIYTGRTEYNLLVHFPGDESMLGKYLPVRLKECRGFYYLGELADEA